jgi:hypothetical protein
MALNANQLAVLGDFNGKEDDDIELFCIQVTRCMGSFGWNQTQASQMVQTRLKGRAGMWMRATLKQLGDDAHLDVWQHLDNNNAVVDETGLRYHLLKRFQEPLTGRGAVEAVSDLKQRAGETVDEFHDRVILAMDRKNYRQSAAQRAQQAYKERLIDDSYTFIAAGLQEDIRKAVLGGPGLAQAGNAADQLEALMVAARNAEKEKKKEKKPKWLSELQRVDSMPDLVGPEEDEKAEQSAPAAPSQELSEIRLELEEIKKLLGRADLVCWACNKKGHFSSNCPNKGRARAKKKTPARQTRKTQRVRRVNAFTKGGRSKKIYVLEDDSSDDDDEEVEEISGDDDDDDDAIQWAWDPKDL